MARIVIGSRRSAHAPPPAVVYEGLTQPDRQPSRRWLGLRGDEQEPRILEQEPPSRLVWSSLWPEFPSAVITFDIEPAGAGASVRWTLEVDEPAPSPGATGFLRRRLNVLIHQDLRDYFDN